MSHTPKKKNTSDNRKKTGKRLICQGELIVLLPVPALAQWTLWLQRVVAAPDASNNGEDESEHDRLGQDKQPRREHRVRVRRRAKHRNRPLDQELLDGGDLDEEKKLEELNRRLQEQLLALSPPAFERLLCRVLEQMRYSDLHRLHNDETHTRALRGMAHLGGTIGKGAGALKVLITAKRYDYPVSRRFVDELRGAMLRHHAQAGLLVTTSTFPPAARRAVREDAHLPVMLLEGARLRRALITYSLGVEQLADGQVTLNPSFFADLETEAKRIP